MAEIDANVVEVATGREQLVAGESAWETGPRWLPDGSGLLMVSDRDGWFQVVRISADGAQRTVLTTGSREHGEPGGGWGYVPVPSPDGKRFAFVEVHDGLVDLLIGDLAAPGAAGTVGGSVAVNPFDGVWMIVGWMPDASAVLAIGRSERSPDELWLLPVAQAAAADDDRVLQERSIPMAVGTGRRIVEEPQPLLAGEPVDALPGTVGPAALRSEPEVPDRERLEPIRPVGVERHLEVRLDERMAMRHEGDVAGRDALHLSDGADQLILRPDVLQQPDRKRHVELVVADARKIRGVALDEFHVVDRAVQAKIGEPRLVIGDDLAFLLWRAWK